MSRACLVDMTRCIGCRGCQVACKQWNELPAEQTVFFSGRGGYQNPPALSSETYTLVGYTEVERGADLQWVFSKRQCMHCLDPACKSACPVAAFEVTSDGAVAYDPAKCMGCRYCMVACPFGIPTFEWGSTVPHIKKCTFCSDRQESGGPGTTLNGQPMSGSSERSFTDSYTQPICAKTCPTGAIQFGERDNLIAEARRRIQASPGKYYQDHIYGEHEAGGTGWLYLSAVPFTSLGFPATETVGTKPYSSYLKAAMDSVPLIVVGGGAVLGGLFWLYQRKLEHSGAGQQAGD